MLRMKLQASKVKQELLYVIILMKNNGKLKYPDLILPELNEK